MKTTSLFKTLTAVFVFTASATLSHAQGGPGDPGPDPDANSTAIPFDGGLSLLAAAGIGYAAKKAYDKRKKDKAAEQREQ